MSLVIVTTFSPHAQTMETQIFIHESGENVETML